MSVENGWGRRRWWWCCCVSFVSSTYAMFAWERVCDCIVSEKLREFSVVFLCYVSALNMQITGAFACMFYECACMYEI